MSISKSHYTPVWANKVLIALERTYDFTINNHDVAKNMLLALAATPHDGQFRDYFWQKFCQSKGYASLIVDENADKARDDFNKTLHALMALHALEFKQISADITRLDIKRDELEVQKAGFKISENKLREQFHFKDDTHSRFSTWMIEHAGINRDDIRKEGMDYCFTAEQRDTISKFMRGDKKHPSYVVYKQFYPQDGLTPTDETSLKAYKKILPIAADLMKAVVFNKYGNFYYAVSNVEKNFEAIDDTAIKNNWAVEPDAAKQHRETIKKALIEKIVETEGKNLYKSDFGKPVKNYAAAAETLSKLSKEYQNIVEACMAFRGQEFFACEESRRDPSGNISKQPALFVKESSLLTIARHVNQTFSARNLLKTIGIDNEGIREELFSYDYENQQTLKPEDRVRYLVISGDENIRKLSALGAKITEMPGLKLAPALFEDSNINSLKNTADENASEVELPNNLIDLESIRANRVLKEKSSKQQR